jgi:hypothetical protein
MDAHFPRRPADTCALCFLLCAVCNALHFVPRVIIIISAQGPGAAVSADCLLCWFHFGNGWWRRRWLAASRLKKKKKKLTEKGMPCENAIGQFTCTVATSPASVVYGVAYHVFIKIRRKKQANQNQPEPSNGCKTWPPLLQKKKIS